MYKFKKTVHRIIVGGFLYLAIISQKKIFTRFLIYGNVVIETTWRVIRIIVQIIVQIIHDDIYEALSGGTLLCRS